MRVLRACLPFLVAVILVHSPAVRVGACALYVDELQPTLLAEYNRAALVLVGTVINAKRAPGQEGGGSAEVLIQAVLKGEKHLAGKKSVTLPWYVAAIGKRGLLFADVSQGALTFSHAYEASPKADIAEYLRGLLAVKDRPQSERLRYAFDYLNSPNDRVARDVIREFAQAEYGDYREIAKSLPADKLDAWLRDPKTPAHRWGFCAFLLGHCGTSKHADLLRGMLDDPKNWGGADAHRIFVGYLLLRPKEGRAYLLERLNDRKQPFAVRFGAWRTVRFLRDNKVDVISRQDLVAVMASMLDDPEVADLALLDLRRWQRWELSDRVLDLFDRESHKAPFIRREILRFALQCRGPRAALFVREQRQRDPEWVSEVEELLRLQAEETQRPRQKKL